MLAKVFPRLVGTVKLVCFLCELWWWKVQLEYGKVWMFCSPHSLRNQHQQHHTTAQKTSKQLAQCNFHHACSCIVSLLFSNMLKDTHTVDYVGQSFPEVGWYGKTCLFSLWILVVKSAVIIWMWLDVFFSITHFATNKQSHTTAQNTSKQLEQCNFHHVCSCMISVLFSNMLKDTHTADYVGQSFPEVGWYGKTCLFSLWILVVKSAVRIWIGLDDFFPSLTSQPTPAAPHNRTKYQQPTCAMQFSPCLFLHDFCPVFQHAERYTYSRLCWPKFSRGWLVR